MIDTHWIGRGGDVIAQHQIQFKRAFPHAGDGRNGVVGLTVGMGENESAGIGVAAPGGEDLIC